MFSAIKRFAGKGDGASNSSVSSKHHGLQTMSSTLQRKFARGVQYNMKIIIKGDRNVGKTCLFQRLQGKKFTEEYLPTDEIQVTSIQWSYKATDDVVKVEVWDVVDKGKKKKHFEGLKLENAQFDLPEETALDAEFLDVYKGTNGIILMMDITKSWTFEYVQREMPKIPSHIPVIILANHCDMSHHRTVTSDLVTYYIESIEGSRTAKVRYSESSMRNGFGLKLLHKFFNLPFLQLQKETLLGQLERNDVETNATIQELDMFAESDEADYCKFQETLTKRRREIADSNANIPQSSVLPISVSSQQLGASNNSLLTDIKRSQSASIIIGGGKPIPYANAVHPKTSSSQSSGKSTSQSSGFVSKFGLRDRSEDDGLPDLRRLEVSPITSVEEFCPDGGTLDRSFLDDVQYSANNVNDVEDSDSDCDTGNPLVSEYQDDLDLEEIKPTIYQKTGGSSELELDMKQTNDEFDSTINSEISELTSEAFDTWMGADSKWRRSPEGGEDVSAVSQTLDYSGSTVYDDSTSVTSSNVHMELLSSKHSHSPSEHQSLANSDSEQSSHVASNKKERKREKDKSEKRSKQKKSKDKEKQKESGKTEKKHKRRSREENNTSQHKDELEEFLNGSPSPCMDAAYEAI